MKFMLFSVAVGLAYGMPHHSKRDVDPALATCGDEFLNNADAAGIDRWRAAGATAAFDNVTADWEKARDAGTTDLSFSQFVGNRFNSRDNIICTDIGSVSCETEVRCNDVNKPAGWLILNSFFGIHAEQSRVHDALDQAMNQMQNKISEFQDTFSPVKPDGGSSWFIDMLNSFTLVSSLVSAYAWNVGFKTPLYPKNTNRYGGWKDASNAFVAFGFNFWKSRTPSPDGVQSDLSKLMDVIFTTWVKGQIDFLHQLFSGSKESLPVLKSLMKDGLALEITEKIDLGDLINQSLQLVYGQLMVFAWKHTSVEFYDQPFNIYPMVMITPGCVKSGDGLHWMIDGKKSERFAVCHDDKTLYLGFPTWADYTSSGNPRKLKLWALPGGENTILDGGDNWGGLKLEDIAISAYEGYKANNHRNGYAMKAGDKGIEGAGSDDNPILDQGVRTPGYVNLPVCTPDRVWQEAKEFVPKKIQAQKAGVDIPITYPCGDGVLSPDEMKAFGMHIL